jgi:hypothetical protein
LYKGVTVVGFEGPDRELMVEDYRRQKGESILVCASKVSGAKGCEIIGNRRTTVIYLSDPQLSETHGGILDVEEP